MDSIGNITTITQETNKLENKILKKINEKSLFENETLLHTFPKTEQLFFDNIKKRKNIEKQTDDLIYLENKKNNKISFSSILKSKNKKFNNEKINSILLGTKNSKKINKQERLNWLSENKYFFLAEELKKENYPSAILKIDDPFLIEQLYYIYQSLKEKSCHLTKKNKIKLFQFCFSKAYKATPLDYSSVRALLGKVLLIIDFDFLEIKLNPAWIEKIFQKRIKLLSLSIQEHQKNHIKFDLHSPDLVAKVLLPIELSKILITKKGKINAGLIKPIIKAFIKDKELSFNHEKSLIKGLLLLKKSPEIREPFNALSLSINCQSQAADIIRTTLRLPSETHINDINAKQTILSAFLSHLRQSPSTSCFAISLAIELLNNEPFDCLKDFVQLLEENSLKRVFQGEELIFPYLLSVSGKNLYKSFIINKDGCFLKKNDSNFFWEFPGIISACRILAIEDPKEIILKILSQIFSTEGHQNQTTIKISILNFLHLLAMEAAKLKKIDEEAALSKAVYAFETEICNPLLAAWKNAIANMGENIKEGRIKTAIVEATIKGLEAGSFNFEEKLKDLNTCLLSELKKILHGSIYLLYDPKIPHHIITPDQNNLSGAFVLYDKHGHKHSHKWLRVNTPQLYQTFCLSILERAKHCICFSSDIFTNHHLYKTIFDYYESYIKSDAFIQNVLWEYDSNNKKYSQPFAYYQFIKFSPWVTKCGSDSKMVRSVYKGEEKKIDKDYLIPPSAEDLLIKILQNIKKNIYEENNYIEEKIYPIRIEQTHAFSLMISQKKLSEINKFMEIEEWMEKTILEPGRKVSETFIEESTRENLLSVTGKKWVAKFKLDLFFEKARGLPRPISHKNFRNALLKIINDLQPYPEETQLKLARFIDSHLCHFLPKKVKKAFERSVFHFADTNWNSGIYDIHFCFLINPGNGNLEMWKAFDIGSHYIALDQNIWLLGQKWVF